MQIELTKVGRGSTGAVVLASAAPAGTTGAHAGGNLVVDVDFENPALVGAFSDYLHTPSGNVVEGS